MFHRPIVVAIAVVTGMAAQPALAQSRGGEERLALVIGQQAYQSGEVPTALNDAGLIADTLKSAGFAVTEASDLNQDDLRRAIRSFTDEVRQAGRGAVSVVYFSGVGVQLEGENYLLPVDARVSSDADIPLEGFRVSDLLRALSGTQAKVNVTILDASQGSAALGKAELAGGLALAEAPERSLVAFAAAPNTLSAEAKGAYGDYAVALAEMMRRPGLGLDALFDDVRVRVHEVTEGRQLPWHDANLDGVRFSFFGEARDSGPVVTGSAPQRQKPRLRGMPVEEAYYRAIEADDVEVYQEFVELYPREPLTERVVVILANRRETVVWRESVRRNNREAYWSYIRLYPNGPHAIDARRRLTRLNAPLRPPETFRVVEYDVLPRPLPVVERYEFRDDRRYVRFEGPRVPRVTETILAPAPQPFIELRTTDRRERRERLESRDGNRAARDGRALPSPAIALPQPEAAPPQQGTVRSFDAAAPAGSAPAARTAPTGNAAPTAPTTQQPTTAQPQETAPATRRAAPTGDPAPTTQQPTTAQPREAEPANRRAAPASGQTAPSTRQAPETAETPTPAERREREARPDRGDRRDENRQARPERQDTERGNRDARRERTQEPDERPTATTPPQRLREERPERSERERPEQRERPQARTPAGGDDAPRPARPQAVPDAPREAPRAAPAEAPEPRRPAAQAIERPEPAQRREAPAARPDAGPGGGGEGPRGGGARGGGGGDGPGRRPNAD